MERSMSKMEKGKKSEFKKLPIIPVFIFLFLLTACGMDSANIKEDWNTNGVKDTDRTLDVTTDTNLPLNRITIEEINRNSKETGPQSTEEQRVGDSRLEISSKNSSSNQGQKEAVENIGEKDKIIIGVTLASEDSSYLKNVVTYMEEAAEEKEAELLLNYADWDADTQAEQIEGYIKQEVDAIILCPVNSKSMLTSLKKVKEAGIPLINLNMKVDSISTEYIDAYVGASMSEEASFAADLVIEALGNDGGEVAILEGSPGSDAQIYRTQAFMKKITSYPQIKVAAIGSGEWDRAKAYMVTKDIVNKNPQIKAIFSQDNNMAMGVIKALEELEKEDSIIVVGIGEDSDEYLEAIKDGRLYGMITQPPSYEGKYSVYTAVKAVSGEELRPWYKDPIEILTKENLK